jgi:hypothetical protein
MGTIDKRTLKSFVRLDGQLRVVAGSLIFRRNMPKVGRWQEVIANVCCNYTTTTTSTSTTTALPYGCTTLGNASPFVVLGSTTVTNTGTSVVTGNLGLSPGTSVVGFPPGIVNGTQHITDSTAAAAKVSAQAAYTCLGALTPGSTLDADIGGTTVTAGIYTFSSSAAITGVLTLNGGGNPNAVFVFIVPSTFTTATSAIVALANGAQAGNVYWIVGTSATLGISSYVVGNIIANTSVTMDTSAILEGRAFALTGAVTLDTNVVVAQTCSVNPCTAPATTTTTTTTAIPVTTTTTTTAIPVTTTTTTTTIL